MNYIFRAVYKRPELLELSLKTQIEGYGADKYATVFAVDGGYDEKVLELVNDFPLPKEVIIRDSNWGLNRNNLEGIKMLMDRTDDFVISLEDDSITTKDFFKFLEYCYDNFVNKDTAGIAGYPSLYANPKDELTSVVRRTWMTCHGYLLIKEPFNKYLREHCNEEYYKDNAKYLKNLFGRDIRPLAFDSLAYQLFKKYNLHFLFPLCSRAAITGFYGGANLRSGKMEKLNYEERKKELESKLVNYLMGPGNMVEDVLNNKYIKKWDKLTMVDTDITKIGEIK